MNQQQRGYNMQQPQQQMGYGMNQQYGMAQQASNQNNPATMNFNINW